MRFHVVLKSPGHKKCHKKIFPPEIAKAGHGQELRPKSEYRHPAQAGDGASSELLAELATRLQSLGSGSSGQSRPIMSFLTILSAPVSRLVILLIDGQFSLFALSVATFLLNFVKAFY